MGQLADPYTESISFFLHYKDPDEDPATTPEIEIFRPSGEPYTEVEISPGEAFHGRAMEPYATLYASIEDPEPGYWKVRVDGQERLTADDMEMQYSHSTEHRLQIEPRQVFTASCAPCWVFEVAHDPGDLETSHVKARGWLSERTSQTADGETYGNSQELKLVDDGSGFDRQAGDDRFTSRPFQAEPEKVYSVYAEMIGLAAGSPFFRRSSQGDLEFGELHIPLPPLEAGKRYGIFFQNPSLAGSEEPLSVQAAAIRIKTFTPEGDAEIEWIEKSEGLTAMFGYFTETGEIQRLSELMLILAYLGQDSGVVQVRAL